MNRVFNKRTGLLASIIGGGAFIWRFIALIDTPEEIAGVALVFGGCCVAPVGMFIAGWFIRGRQGPRL